ncbi:MAG: hypothetical protein IKO89_00145 [Bacteroidales bacterium]|nr:hypothetical protein [Bacteroidales bacterium]
MKKKWREISEAINLNLSDYVVFSSSNLKPSYYEKNLFLYWGDSICTAAKRISFVSFLCAIAKKREIINVSVLPQQPRQQEGTAFPSTIQLFSDFQ